MSGEITDEEKAAFSSRARKMLNRRRITRWDQLAACRAGELRRERNFGETSLEEVRQRLADRGLALDSEKASVKEDAALGGIPPGDLGYLRAQIAACARALADAMDRIDRLQGEAP